MLLGRKVSWRSSPNGPPTDANASREHCVPPSNYPTQAKRRLEWGTRLEGGAPSPEVLPKWDFRKRNRNDFLDCSQGLCVKVGVMEWKEEEALVRATRPYDQNGNAISKANSSGTTNYAWDFENRLTSVTLPNGGGVVSFKYDPFGRRIEKSGPSGTTIYAYDGANVSEELTSAGSPSMRYVQGAGIDEPLAESSTSVNYFSADGLGSITSLEDTTGTPQATFVYGAFGVLRSSTGSATSSYRYTAREYDQDTGLYYSRARYYDASNGRFLSQNASDSQRP